MTKNNNTPIVAICHNNEEIVGDIKHVMVRDHNAAVGSTLEASQIRATFRVSNPVKILVLDQSINPAEIESIWTDVTPDPSMLVVVAARSGRDQKKIAETDRRIVVGPLATSTDILDAIEKLRIRRGRKARAAFEAGVIWLDPASGRVRVHNRDIKVPADQFKLLEILASQPFRTFPKEELAVTMTGGTAISRSDVRFIERTAHRLRDTLANAHLAAVIEPAGIGFQLFSTVFEKTSSQPVLTKAAA